MGKKTETTDKTEQTGQTGSKKVATKKATGSTTNTPIINIEYNENCTFKRRLAVYLKSKKYEPYRDLIATLDASTEYTESEIVEAISVFLKKEVK